MPQKGGMDAAQHGGKLIVPANKPLTKQMGLYRQPELKGEINLNISNQEYGRLVKRHSPPSAMYKTIPLAFVIGGGICVLGEALLNMFAYFGFDEQTAGMWTSISLIFLSALFTGLKLYDRIAQYAGAGTLVPITGFANSVVSPALDFKSEGFILGLGAKMFVIAGPVIVYGISASIIYGIIYYIYTLFQGVG